MYPHASVCAGCGAADFPPRLRCHRCGGLQFSTRPIPEATVITVTRVHRVPAGCPYDHLVELSAEAGLRMLAAASFSPTVGCTVGLVQADDGAIVIPRYDMPDAHPERTSHG
jgi:uncharacterized OB-fold protein